MQNLLLLLALAQSPADSTLLARADAAARAFVDDWRLAWQGAHNHWVLGSDARLAEAGLRTQAVHCHFSSASPRIAPHVISGSTPAHASCPIWFQGPGPVEDERRLLDHGIVSYARSEIALKRTQLRALLDSAAAAFPGNRRTAQQRVRFALEVNDYAAAAAAAAACPDCTMLRGLVAYRAGRVPEADSLFMAALAAMSADERCLTRDVRALLEAQLRIEYSGMSCAQRDSMEATLWWLSDPLWLEPGNERRAEHFARVIYVRLLAATNGDGRQRLEPQLGGEALVETLLRYGWPSYVYWAGPRTDLSHTGWLLQRGAAHAEPYASREYFRENRLHTVPDTAALRQPFRARPEHWDLTGPPDDQSWWPIEHFARDRGAIVTLAHGQDVLLLRAEGARYAWATLSHDSTTATLLESRAVGSVSVTTTARPVDGRLVIDTYLAPGLVLLGIEAPGDSARPAARTRFALEVPGPISNLRALSQPLLFEPGDAPVTADSAIARMHGSTTFRAGMRLGVYWEGYGFTEADTVDVEIRVVREDRPGLLSRAIAAIGLGDDGNVDIAIRWRDVPGTSRATHTTIAGVPVQMRHISLDVSRLTRGDYRLSTAMTVPGGTTVRGERRFSVR